MPGAGQLLGAGQTSRTRTHHSDFFAGLVQRALCLNPAFLPPSIANRALYGFDTDRIVIDIESAGRFTRSRANTASKLGEVVRQMQNVQRFTPLVAVNQIVQSGVMLLTGPAVLQNRTPQSLQPAACCRDSLSFSRKTNLPPCLMD